MLAPAFVLVAAHQIALTCPPELPPEAVQVTRVSPGWTGLVPARLLLNAAGVTVGPPEQRATLRGEQHQIERSGYRVAFTGLRGWKDEKWLTCEYGAGRDVVLARPLPAGVDRCEVRYTAGKYGNNYELAISCR